MNQRVGLVVLVFCVACGSSKPEPTVVSNGSAEPELRCKVAIERASAKVKVEDKDVTMAIGECEQKEWSRQARECVAAAEKDADLVACATKNDLAKHGMFADSTTFDDAMKQMGAFKDKMCACSDMTCAQKVSDEMTKWAQDMSKTMKDPPKMTDEQMKHATAIGEEMGKCMQRAMGASGTP